MTGFLFQQYAAVWRSREDDINAVVYIPVEVRSAPDSDGDVRCYIDPKFSNTLDITRCVMRSHFWLPLAELVLDVA